jgi:ubiquinone/menaquinone biosynthesis C-methylase UbiE/uncharacterized protein YbaR (Trm112 family)
MTILNTAEPNFLSQLVVCTRCKSDLEQKSDDLVCTQCGHSIPVIEGIPRFIELTPGDLDERDPIEHRQKYEQSLQSAELAQGYNDSFKTISRDKKRSHRELHILDTLLGMVNSIESLLDIPCGGGRLSAPLAAKTENLINMDASLEQVKLAMAVQSHTTPRFGASASALALPLKDKSIDGILNARLSHHLPSMKERAKLLDELIRVARKFIIFSFTDVNSTNTFYRKIRGKKAKPITMSVSEIEVACSRHDAKLVKIMTCFRFGSRHRFALIEL